MLVGRDAEIDLVLHAVTGRAGREPAHVVVRGGRGIGKSALLRAVADELAGRGMAVLDAGSLPAANRGLVGALRDVVLREFERNEDAELLGPIAELGRWAASWHATAPAVNPVRLVHEFGRAVEVIAAGARGTVFLLDDLHRADPATMAAVRLLSHRVRAAGCAVVVSVDEGHPADDGACVIDLAPLSERSVETMLVRRLPAGVDSGLPAAVAAALGPLAGNPGAVHAVIGAAREDGRLRTVDGQICLVRPELVPRLADDHHAVRGVLDAGPAVSATATALAVAGAAAIDDLPAAVAAVDPDAATEPGTVGRAIDELVERGLVETIGAADVRFVVPAVAAALAARLSDERRQRVHAAMALRLAGRAGTADTVATARQAGHLAVAGPLPDLPGAADVLAGEAERIAATDPALAAELACGALDRTGPTDPRWPDRLRDALAKLDAAGRYDRVADVAARAYRQLTGRPGDGATDLVTDVVRHWVVALLQDNRVGALADLLARMPHGHADLLGDDLATAVELTLWCAGLAPGDPGARHAAAHAMTHGDLTAFVPRPRCASPAAMPRYHQMYRAFELGDWDEALRLARRAELEPVDDPRSFAGDLARALAAEICLRRGELRRAAAWLADVAPPPACRAIVARVRCGLLAAEGRHDEALRHGLSVRTELRAAGELVGLAELLGRLVELAVEAGRPADAQALLDESRQVAFATGVASDRRAHARAEVVVHRSPAAALRLVELTRTAGDPYDIARACLLAGHLVDDPEPLLREAHGIFGRLGARAERATAGRAMRERGVAVRRNRPSHASFSGTERRVMELVVAGLTNRQIAGAISVGEKTVEGNLTRLFAKTGCRSRVELAAAMVNGRIDVA